MSKAINLDSMVERDMRLCLVDFQATVPPPKVKTYSFVTLVSSESHIQFASLNTSKTEGNVE